MIDTLLSYLAPHYCCGCGQIGDVICDNCKYNITSESFNVCLSCGKNLINEMVCSECKLPYSHSWCVGERSGVLQRAIGEYKFQHKRAACKDLGDMIVTILPDLPLETIIVPVPTVTAHIRERGFDHAYLLARHVAECQGLTVSRVIKRQTSTKQRDADKRTRQRQAKEAFRVDEVLSSDVPYLLLDDVVTTGATVKYAAEALRQAGARQIWVVAIARQPLD